MNRFSITRFEKYAGIVSILVSISIYYSQSPLINISDYLVPFIPVFFIVPIIATTRIVEHIRHIKTRFALISGTKIYSNMIVKIHNQKGDATYEKTRRMIITNSNTKLWETMEESVYSEHEMISRPPQATINNSSVQNRTLSTKYFYTSNVDVSGIAHNMCAWRYDISPPLSKLGDFIEYTHKTFLPKAEERSFSSEGSIYFYNKSNPDLIAELTLISPPGFKFEVINNYFEDFDGTRIQESGTPIPQIQSGGHVLIVKPEYRKDARYILQYKLTQADVSSSI